MNISNQIVFILDDEKSITEVLDNYLKEHLKDVDVYTFNTKKELLKHPLVKDVSLFVLDIDLHNHLTGDEVALELNKITDAPYLFMSGRGYTFDKFQNTDFTCDYLSKPFELGVALNRIKLLLKVSRTYKDYINEKENLKVSLKELFVYTNIYMVILDEDMKIKLCSYLLAKDLGYKKESELVGKSWKQFVLKDNNQQIDIIHKNVLEDSKQYQNSMREITNKIKTKRDTTIEVKWFNSRIDNSNTYTFSIGIPYNREVTASDNIETIRAYWKHVIDKNDITLSALKSRI
jgi:PAS domain S-box-containing protein